MSAADQLEPVELFASRGQVPWSTRTYPFRRSLSVRFRVAEFRRLDVNLRKTLFYMEEPVLETCVI